jgi:hypothetical protein
LRTASKIKTRQRKINTEYHHCHYFICKKDSNNKKAIDCVHVWIYEVEASDYEPSNATNRYAKEISDCGQNISYKYTRQLRIQSLRQHILVFISWLPLRLRPVCFANIARFLSKEIKNKNIRK